MNRLGFTEKEVGRMTLKKWQLLYRAYQKNFDNEMLLTLSRTTYEEATREVTIDDVIPY